MTTTPNTNSKFTSRDQQSYQQQTQGQLESGWPHLNGRPLSLLTVKAARPNSKFDTRQQAAEWNRQFAKYPELQVNLSSFRDVIPERSQSEIDANLRRLDQHWKSTMSGSAAAGATSEK